MVIVSLRCPPLVFCVVCCSEGPGGRYLVSVCTRFSWLGWQSLTWLERQVCVYSSPPGQCKCSWGPIDPTGGWICPTQKTLTLLSMSFFPTADCRAWSRASTSPSHSRSLRRASAPSELTFLQTQEKHRHRSSQHTTAVASQATRDHQRSNRKPSSQINHSISVYSKLV